uniref:Membrane integral NOTCH2 associated receptor 1 n=1 Tax=Sinocyclocheilus grahami TaxID=75366 RepID=A0A672K5X0_SINGR
MDAMPEYSLFLVRILEELDTKYSTVSYQDLCKSLCARFDLVHLAKLRSLLFYTACLDPAFPATLFKDKMRCSVEDQQSKKLMVAADIVTMFNLIQMNGGMAKDKLPMGRRPKFHKNQSFESCRSDTDVYKFNDNDRGYNLMDTRGHHVSRKSPCPKSDCNNCQQFIPTSEPNFLLGVTKDLKCRAASLDKLQHLPQYSSVSPPPCEMQSTYFPMDIDSESTTDQESLHANPGIKDVFVSSREPFTVHSCMQKRNVFKEDFHNLVAFSPHVITTECRANPKAGGEYHHRRELSKPPTFFNHSFELNGSLSQVTKSDRDSSPDQNTVKLGKTGIKLDRLFQSLENSDDELKESVCKLVLRIGEIEKKLESLSGVRGEISQVLSKLTRLDEKIQEPEANGKSSDNGHVEQVKTDANLSPHVFQCHTTGHNMKVEKSPEWCCSEADGSEILRVKALKKSMFIRRSSRSLNEDNSATESKVASINNSPRDWRTVSYSGHTGDEGKENDRHSEGKDRHRKPREVTNLYTALLYLLHVEFVFVRVVPQVLHCIAITLTESVETDTTLHVPFESKLIF